MMFIDAFKKYVDKLGRRNLITNVYGIARSVLAFGTLITFAFNSTSTLFSNIPYHYDIITTSKFGRISIFYLFPHQLNALRIVSIGILLIVVSGWRPRIMAIFHWYVTYSFFTSCDFFDGGDQIASILTFFLLPFGLFDTRKWVWHTQDKSIQCNCDVYKNIFLNILSFIIRLQICVIYFQAGVAKMKVDQWIDGTATYYWFTNNAFGASAWIKPLIISALSEPIVVVFFTWGTMIFETVLSMAIMMTRNKWNWRILLILGIIFHFGIVLIHGLISFFFTMTAALVLYLVPLNKQISLKKIL